jgi:hypothetical protein
VPVEHLAGPAEALVVEVVLGLGVVAEVRVEAALRWRVRRGPEAQVPAANGNVSAQRKRWGISVSVSHKLSH